MTVKLYESIGTVRYDNLINSVSPPAEVFGIDLEAGQGILERGSVLVRNNGEMKLISGEEQQETLAKMLTVIAGTSTNAYLSEKNLVVETLKVFKSDDSEAEETTDYTAEYLNGILNITIDSEGALAAYKSVKVEISQNKGAENANCILADEVDTGLEAGTAVSGVAYRTGHFNSNALIVAEGYTLTDNDKESLREVGILISQAL